MGLPSDEARERELGGTAHHLGLWAMLNSLYFVDNRTTKSLQGREI